MNVEGRSGRERPKMGWLDTNEIDEKAAGVCVWRMWKIETSGGLELGVADPK